MKEIIKSVNVSRDYSSVLRAIKSFAHALLMIISTMEASAQVHHFSVSAPGGGLIPEQTAGIPLFIEVVARDSVNGVVADFTGSVDISSSGNILSGGGTTPLFSSGLLASHQIIFSNTGLFDIAAMQTAGTAAGMSNPFNVVSGSPTGLIFLNHPGDGLGGALLTPPAVVGLIDSFGNAVRLGGKPVSLSVDPAQGILAGTLTKATDDSGRAAFDDLRILSFGDKFLTASADSLTPALGDTFNLRPITISASPSLHGSITPSGLLELLYGSSQNFTVTAETGYHADSVVVDGLATDSLSSFTFTNITENHTIAAYFSINRYQILSAAGPHGTISPAGTLIFDHLASQTYLISPDFGYLVDTLMIDGTPGDPGFSYLFDSIDANHSIYATFKKEIPALRVKIFLQGAYVSNSMTTNLNSILPLSQPYDSSPWSYSGTESVPFAPAGAVDWLLVELRSSTAAASMTERRAGFIMSDGTVKGLDGSSDLAFPESFIGDYYVVLYHRNHLPVMSATALNLSSASELYDFTAAGSRFYGSGGVMLDALRFGMYAGDSSHDKFVDSDDYIGPDNNMFKNGYGDADHSLDGFIDSDDFIYPDNNMFKISKVPE